MHRKPAVSTVSRQAVDELQVFLRTMGAAQRRWAKEISTQESKVRKLMMLEDQCRERLRRSVLRGTYANLKYLVNTDLLTAAHVTAPPPPETFLFHGIPAAQVTAFSAYAISRLWADPDRVDLPPLTLIADLQSAWFVLTPSKRAVYEQLATAFRKHIENYTPPPIPPVKSSLRARTRAAATVRRARQRVSSSAKPKATTTTVAACNEVAAAGSEAWEVEAFNNFAKLSRRHICAALAKGQQLSAKEWAPIAQAEWLSKTALQKRSYLKENS